jgi:MFS superfamily sulfate permease-like transporter
LGKVTLTRQEPIYIIITMPNNTACGTALRVLPWAFVILGVLLLVIGLMWRHITDDHEANAALIIPGVVLVAVAFATSCVREMPTEDDDDAPKQDDGQPVKNMGSGAEFNKVPFLGL